jgi:response regulator RpfG family c-di-GMP phosphodiesterase
MKKFKILLVDDDENILYGYRRNLRRDFEVLIAQSSAIALKYLNNEKDIAVIISDYNMPEMKGTELMQIAKRLSPDTVRILLTGFANLDIAVGAVNEGSIFKFLTKPCPYNTLEDAILQAVDYYRAITSEKEILEKTLKGIISILVEILNSINPLAFNQSDLYKNLAKRVFDRLELPFEWEIEVSILLSRIGCVAVPHEILDKKDKGEELTPEEKSIYYNHTIIGKKLLGKIPRFEMIAKVIEQQYNEKFEPEVEKPPKWAFTAWNTLRLINAYYELLEKGKTSEEAIKGMYDLNIEIDESFKEALIAEIIGAEKGYLVKIVKNYELKPGMRLAEDLYDSTGFLLLHKGSALSEITLMKIDNYSKMRGLKEPIKVLIKKQNETKIF